MSNILLSRRRSLIFISAVKRFIQKTAATIVHGIQSRKGYRKLIKKLNPAVVIREKYSESPGTPTPSFVWTFTAEWKSKTIGTLHLVRYPPEYAPYLGFWLMGLQVEWNYRGLGTGEHLCLAAIDRARVEGAEEIHLLVNERNLPAMQLYEKIGFEQISVPAFDEVLFREKKQTGTTRILMRLTFSNQ
ncbi:MAG TPA: GNAT family N-acetyltransferase [Methanolinea sp.]|nr:GNAT family N-acetyltransferase [Methanolinea sp.]HNS82316.1 GNAT family N-acetyltransferase [Methanolinea sp.]